jgi:hypothetical protein
MKSTPQKDDQPPAEHKIPAFPDYSISQQLFQMIL